MAIQQNPYPLRIDPKVMDKVKYLARENGRSANKEIEYILKRTVRDYENKNGVILLSDDTGDF